MLAPGAQILFRQDGTIQFGVDAARAGVLPLSGELSEKVARVLESATTPSRLYQQLITAGFSELSATSLLGDLVSHGILREVNSWRLVAVLGHGSLPELIMNILGRSNYAVRRPTRAEPPSMFFRRLDSDVPLVITNWEATARSLAPRLRRKGTVIPVTIADGRGIIGPIMHNSAGACLMCTELYRADADPQWQLLLRQSIGTSRHDPLAEHAVASVVANVVAALFHSRPFPGARPLVLAPGEIVEVEAGALAIDRRTMSPHPLCPVCFDAGRTP